ncbi:hypothetical protein BT96DRAFT_983585 [Gymnopus androsaceus JB14]|uniref:C3H1-type domain-containing protein n=1 Tax=Gymnopus androsaceus JB14 TaxID=1447944 RepID=A0A6A4IR42_9AGAR|nr:hypothetical protein BT96DRAFT_983585 [Gymnopus androsaceus JB14]
MSRPNILVLGLMDEDYLADLFAFLMSSMRAVAQVKLVTQVKEAKALLAARPPPTAVLSIDAAPTESKYRSLNEQLVRYAQAATFRSFAPGDVPWALGDYHRTTVYLNKDNVPGMDLTGLDPSYSVKALNLAQVPPNSAVYSPSPTSRTQSHVFAPNAVDTSETPAAYAKVKDGYLGYTGDVNASENTTKIIMAMLHLPINAVGPDSRNKVVGASIIGGVFVSGSGHSESWRETPRGIPLRVDSSVPRPREAEVKARAVQRTRTTEKKKAAAEKLKDKGNNVFKAGNYEQAVDFYKQACKTYKPLPVYMSNLAAAFLKLERWEEAEDAADHATLVDPNLLKGYFRRGVARTHLGKPDGAIRDFQRCLKIDPNCADAKTELEVAKKASIIKYKHKADDEFEDDEVKLTFGLSRDFVPGRTLHVLDCPSDSEEYRHSGNGRPCRYYNHNGCQFGKSCRYKHAPDVRSVRDELGRNVCLHFLIDRCKFDDRCWYAHDKTYLPSNGWWHDESLGEYQDLYDQLKMDIDDGVLDRLGGAMNGTAMPWAINAYLKKLVEERLEFGDENSDDDDYGTFRGSGKAGGSRQFEREMDERAQNFGFTSDEVNELLCQGVKPWDDDAWVTYFTFYARVHPTDYLLLRTVLNALNGNYC